MATVSTFLWSFLVSISFISSGIIHYSHSKSKSTLNAIKKKDPTEIPHSQKTLTSDLNFSLAIPELLFSSLAIPTMNLRVLTYPTYILLNMIIFGPVT